jgi:hypothetical protein
VWCAVVGLHYPFREEEVPEERGDEQVGAIDVSEKLPRDHGPSNARCP